MIHDVSFQLIGSDVLVYAPFGVMDEGPLRRFLETQ